MPLAIPSTFSHLHGHWALRRDPVYQDYEATPSIHEAGVGHQDGTGPQEWETPCAPGSVEMVIFSVVSKPHGGTGLESQRLGSGNKEVGSSRPSWIHSKLETSLGYLVSYLQGLPEVRPLPRTGCFGQHTSERDLLPVPRCSLLPLSLCRSGLLTA